MSAATRAALAEAANSVTGIRVVPYFRMVTIPGQGTVRLDRTEYPNRLGGVDWWQIVVTLPQDLEAAERMIDQFKPLLVAALGEEMAVRSATPSNVVYDSGQQLPSLIIEGTRESE